MSRRRAPLVELGIEQLWASVVCVFLLSGLVQLVGGQALVVVPVSTNNAGKYFATVRVGTPAVSYNLMLSSATSDLLLSSSECTPRCDFSPAYAASNSTTSQSLCAVQPTCTFVQEFAGHDATAAGNSYTDAVSVGGVALSALPLGAWTSIHNMHLLLPTPMVGVLGLQAAPQDGSVSNSTLLGQVTQQNGYAAPVYSMCLGEYAGTLLFGGVDDNLHSGNWQVAAMNAQLAMTTTAISVDRTPLDLSSVLVVLNPTYVDTSFRELVLNEAIYNILANTMRQHYCPQIQGLCEDGFFGPNERCYYIDPPDLVNYPTITLKLAGTSADSPVELVLQPDQWLMFVQKKGYCLAIISSPDPSTRIGTQALTGYYTAVDFAASTVSFSPPTNCSGAMYKISMVSGNGQKGPVSTAAKEPLVVRVLTLDTSEPVEGVYVNFQVTEGSGSLSNVMPTDAEGKASAQLRFGYAEGKLTITASLALAISSPIVFTAESERPIVFIIMSVIFTTLLVIGLAVIYVITDRHRKQQHERLINSPIYHLLASADKASH